MMKINWQWLINGQWAIGNRQWATGLVQNTQYSTLSNQYSSELKN
jgi:hypothetical protein